MHYHPLRDPSDLPYLEALRGPTSDGRINPTPCMGKDKDAQRGLVGGVREGL